MCDCVCGPHFNDEIFAEEEEEEGVCANAIITRNFHSRNVISIHTNKEVGLLDHWTLFSYILHEYFLRS